MEEDGEEESRFPLDNLPTAITITTPTTSEDVEEMDIAIDLMEDEEGESRFSLDNLPTTTSEDVVERPLPELCGSHKFTHITYDTRVYIVSRNSNLRVR